MKERDIEQENALIDENDANKQTPHRPKPTDKQQTPTKIVPEDSINKPSENSTSTTQVCVKVKLEADDEDDDGSNSEGCLDDEAIKLLSKGW